MSLVWLNGFLNGPAGSVGHDVEKTLFAIASAPKAA
jgi:hypothetical protein